MLAKRLKLLREKQGKGQQEVCAALNIEQSTLANYENGKRVPKIDILIKIARYYNVSTDYLLGMVNQKIPYGLSSYSGQNENTGKSILFWIGKTGLGDGEYPFRFDPEISRRLKEQMQRMGESYSQIAAAIGIEEDEVFDFLEYGFVPHISVFVQIVEHFLVSSDFLLNRTGSTLTIQEDEEELLLSYRALNSKSKTMALSRIYELEREESLVAAKNRYLDSEGKSLPSSGTGGGTMVG